MNFWQFFRFLCLCILTLLMQKRDFGRTSKLQHAKMHVLGNQKSGFFKVWDTLTMIQLRKKKHLTNVSSPLKTFFDHLQGRWENRKKSIFSIFWVGSRPNVGRFWISPDKYRPNDIFRGFGYLEAFFRKKCCSFKCVPVDVS